MATDVTLAIYDGVTEKVTFTFQSSDLESCKPTIRAQVDENIIPFTGPTQTQLFDFTGTGKIITLRGKLTAATTSRTTIASSPTATTITTIAEQKKWLESIAGGNQIPLTFTSNFDSQSVVAQKALSAITSADPYASTFANTTVMIESLDFEEVEGINNVHMPFTLTLKVGTF